jgi:hypothetical protein
VALPGKVALLVALLMGVTPLPVPAKSVAETLASMGVAVRMASSVLLGQQGGTGTSGSAGTSGSRAQSGSSSGSAADDIPVYLPGGEEAGPTLASQRGIRPIRSAGGLFRIAPYIGIEAIYDTGLAPLALGTDGAFPKQGAAGVNANFGVTGSRVYRQSMLTLAYQGGYTHYPRIEFLSNSNHTGVLGVNHAFSRRLQLNSSNSFGYMNNAFMMGFGFAGYTPPGATSPVDEFFNTPIFFANTNQILSYQKSARWSFSGGGGGAIQRRRSSALVGVTTVNALGNTSFRMTRRQTIGVTYSFNQFFFTNQYGGSNVHNLMVEYGAQPTRTVNLSLSVGGARVESQSLRVVQVDPLIAALFGTTSGIEALYRKNYLPTLQAQIAYTRRQWTFDASAGRTINPGNGIVLTNRNTFVNAGLRYSTRKWNAGLMAGYNEMTGIKLDDINFVSYSTTASFGLVLARGISWTSSVSYREFGGDRSAISNAFPNREQYRVSTGIYWSPSAFPLPLF